GIMLCCVEDGRNVVIDNLIGIGPSGIPLGNGQAGITIDRTRYNIVGPGNTIAHNLGDGISFWDDTPYNTVTQNSIHDHSGRGIAQGTPPPPAILNFDLQAGTVSGTACANCTVEIFSDSGDEGAIYEGRVVADGNGAFIFEKGAPLAGPFLTATATDPDGNTSEFSQPSQ
ncbi:MAG TPA: Ig-like domain-containing protein, partial [Anaerolineales bacterium]